jgi:hypothetical protein
MDESKDAVVTNQDDRGTTVKTQYINETPVAVAKAMSIMGGWMFLWTGALLLLILV